MKSQRCIFLNTLYGRTKFKLGAIFLNFAGGAKAQAFNVVR